MTETLDGRAIAAEIRSELEADVRRLADAGARPTLATIHMGDDPAAETYIRLKHEDCEEIGVEGRHVDLDPDDPAERLYEVIDDLNADPDVDGILLQDDVPEHVTWQEAVRRIDPAKDVDGVHPENAGRLATGDPRFVPCTPLGVRHLLREADVDLTGADVVIVNNSNIVGRPLANLLVGTPEDPQSTVTVCHAATENLGEKTRQADVLVVAVGIPEFVDESMVSEGTTVIDVGITRVETDDGTRQVGDVDFESVAPKADAITPNPGGVGPMTRVMLQYNTVTAAAMRADVDVEVDLDGERVPDAQTV